MAGSSLLALIDDITTIMDDVAVLTKTASAKTAGVMGDDLALNAEQVSGVSVDRELPVVWAVAKGSFINKLILVPAALAISAFVPALIMPLMIVGGLFLCYEGFEKVVHKLGFGHGHADPDPAERAHHAAHLEALTQSSEQVVAVERDKIKGAIRTDFVLSAEIVVITLGTLGDAPMLQQVLALSAVAIGSTVFVYGLVAGIVKLDDAGLALQRRPDAASKRTGGMILRTAPWLMKALGILGTIAMFTVGGSIIMHGVPFLEAHAHDIVHDTLHLEGFAATALTTVLDAVVGIIAGALVLAIVMLAKRLRGGGAARAHG